MLNVAADHGHDFIGRMGVGRNLVVRRELQTHHEHAVLGRIAVEERHLRPLGKGRRPVLPGDVTGIGHDMLLCLLRRSRREDEEKNRGERGGFVA